MRILVATRLYSAMLESMRTRRWQPRGMPAYYKLLEALDPKHELDVVCLGKLVHEGIDGHSVFRFSGMRANFHLLAYRKLRYVEVHINNLLNEIAQFFYVLRLILEKRYDLIYLDRAHVTFGAILSLVFRKKVVYRLHGAGFVIRRLEDKRSWFKEPFRCLSYKAPFSYILSTKDGSGAGHLIKKYMSRRAPYDIVLNGVDRFAFDRDAEDRDKDFIRSKYSLDNDRRIILFLCRLSADKGAQFLMTSIAQLAKINRDFFFLVVGGGPLRRSMEEEAEAEGVRRYVGFEEKVNHDEVYRYYRAADVYVSLNISGNLCNTVLEAVNAGKCVVTFGPDAADHTDADTEEILSDCAVFIDKRRIIEELPSALDRLLRDEEKVRRLSGKARTLAEKLFCSWEERVDREAALLEEIAHKRQESS